MPEDGSAADNEAIFAKFAAHVARNRSIVQSWMVGAKERPSRFAKYNSAKIDEEDAETFDIKPEPELAGLGSNTSNLTDSERAKLDPELRLGDASVAFLHQQLLGGKKSKTPKVVDISRSGHGLHGVDISFHPSRRTTNPTPQSGEAAEDASSTQVTQRAQATRPESDDEDEVGRSGIGNAAASQPVSNKRNFDIRSGSKKSVSKKQFVSATNASEDSDEDQEEEPSQRVKGKKRATSYLDELLASKSSKQKRKKN